MSTNPTKSEAALRNRATRRGLKLSKGRDGVYRIVEPDGNYVVREAYNLDEAAAALDDYTG